MASGAEGCESLAESGGLENRYGRKAIGGSNPSPSANKTSAI
jgi:hypothetical protein